MTDIEFSTLLMVISQLGSRSQSNEWIPLISTLGGAFIGAAVSYYSTLGLERRRARQFSIIVKKALLSEMGALIDIVRRRRFIEHLQEMIAENCIGEISSCIPEHYCRVYQEHCKNLGVLDGEDAIKIVKFYQYIDAVVQDIKDGGTFSQAPSIEGFQEAINLLNDAINEFNSIEVS
ncbi:MAG: hypothetical protein ACRCRW_10385 [Aeromonadaceae bacterium]